MDNLECMHSIQRCCVFRIGSIVLSHSLRRRRVVAVLSPRATAPLWSRDTTDTVAFVSHFPRALQGSQVLYICRGTKRPVSAPREKGLIQRWVSRGQDVIVCFSSVVRHGSSSDAAEGGLQESKGCLLSSVTARTDWKHVVPLLHTNH